MIDSDPANGEERPSPCRSGAYPITVHPLLTVRDVARVLGVHERTVWRLASLAETDGESFPRPIRIGGKTVRWRWRDIEAYIDGLAADSGQN